MVAKGSEIGLNPFSVGLTNENMYIVAPLMKLDNHQMNLTRYPNFPNSDVWMPVEMINTSAASKTYPTLQIEDETYWNWSYRTEDFLYYGYPIYSWAPGGFFGVADPEEKTVTALQYSYYGSTAGTKPFRVFNAFESIDEPGEWYYDKSTDLLYEITFGMYTINATDVRAIMLVDGIELFNEVITDSALVNAQAYFGAYATEYATVKLETIEPVGATEEAYTSMTVDSMIDEVANWSDFKYGDANAAEPEFEDDSLVLQGTTGFSVAGHGTARKNVVYRFKYTQDITNGGYAGFYISLDRANNFPWNTRGVMVQSSADNLAVMAFAIPFNGTSFISQQDRANMFESNREYDIEFGFYNVTDSIVRAILKVDGEEIFNIPTDNEALRSASGYFGVFTSGAAKVTLTKTGEVTEEPTEPEETYTELAVNDMIADTEKWAYHYGDSKFENGSISMTGTDPWDNIAGYNTAYSNTVYKFKYVQDRRNADGNGESGCSGFHIALARANTRPAWGKGVAVMSEDGGLYLRLYNTMDGNPFRTVTASAITNFESGKEYEIEFGMYAISETEVRIILKVDGVSVFNVVTNEKSFRGATGYFGIWGWKDKTVTVSGVEVPDGPGGSTEPSEPEETYTELAVDDMLADTANWAEFRVYHDNAAAKPTFGAGSISITGTADYYNAAGYKTAYSNTVYKFKYTQDKRTADGTEGSACSFKITLDNASNMPLYAKGIEVESSQSGLYMKLYNTTNGSAPFKSETAKDGFNLVSGKEYVIEFGMYAISDTEVRIILKVDGVEIFNVVTDDESFRSATGYFGINCYKDKTVTISGIDPIVNYVAAIGEDKYETLQEAVEAASAGQTIKLLKDVTVDTFTTLNMVQGTNGQSGTYAVKAAVVLNGVNLDGNGYTLTVTGLGDKSADGDDTAIWTNGGTISNLTINGGARGIFFDGNLAADIDLNNVIIENSCRPVNVSGGTTATYALNATGCTFAGKISYGEKALTDATFAGCNFTVQSGAKGDILEPYTNTTLANCTFADGYVLSTADLVAGKKIVKSGTTNAVAPEGYIWDTDGALVRCNVVEVDRMLADTANWKDFSYRVSYPISLPVYENGTISMPGENSEALENFNKDGSVVGYKTAYANTLYKFKYTQTVHTSGTGGFYIGVNEPNNIPWNSGGVLVTSSGSLDIQSFIKSSTESGTSFVKQNSTDVFVSGQTYDIEFGMYDIGENTVRVILRVDGKEIYNIVSEGSYFYSKPVYFGIYNRKEATVTVSGMQVQEPTDPEPSEPEETYTVLALDDMLADTANWAEFRVYHDNAAAKPTFGAGSISITGTADYYNAAGYKTAYSNTVYKFKYTQDKRTADGTEGSACSFKITLNNATNMPLYAKGIEVESNQYGLYMKLYNTTDASAPFKSETAKDGFNLVSGKEYEIEFGMYAISDTEVRIILKVDGVEIFNVVTDDESFRSATGYFGINCYKDKTVTVSGMQAVEAV